jgi:NAD+ synthase (glutamine-hydrolysing)
MQENNMNEFGFVRVTAASHKTHIANPAANAAEAIRSAQKFPDSDVIVFGELSLSGYTCADLFAQEQLLTQSLEALRAVTESTIGKKQLLTIGLPIRVLGKLHNAAAAICDGQVLGIVPKQYLPNYQEFYEARWFAAADGSEPTSVELPGIGSIPFGIDLLFSCGQLVVGIEICEDLWMPIPPSSLQAASGANLLINLSASNEIVGKAGYRELLVRSQSGRCLAAYTYASAGPTESTTDIVFGGHCLIAENGSLLAESRRVGQAGCVWLEESHVTADIDLQRLAHDRQMTLSWQQAASRCAKPFRRIQFESKFVGNGSRRAVPAWPFVPKQDQELDARCSEIFGIQCASLAKRVSRLPVGMTLNIGISGGLDSTLALLVAVKTCANLGWPSTRIAGITMPGFGTTSRTLDAARILMQQLNITADEIDIRQLCLDTFRSLQHKPFGIDVSALELPAFVEKLQAVPSNRRQDLVFENVQARVRTLLLMNRGFVLGTGDLSEQALGWSTYNGDHMSMYNVNTSIPKTLVKFLVKHVAEKEFQGEIQQCLLSVVSTPISPELLPPGATGQIEQLTENSLGAYELHDFFLYHIVRFGMTPSKVLYLASLANFSREYSTDEIKTTLRNFYTRFFSNQFKRSCVPDGPKVGSVSLSPRGDWRMPSDAESAAWLKELD